MLGIWGPYRKTESLNTIFFSFFFWKYNNLSLPRKIPFDLCLLSPLERNSVVSGNVQGWMLTDTGNGERA